MDTLKLLEGSIEYQRQVKALEKAERILELIKIAAVKHQAYLHDSKLDYNRWIGRSEKLAARAELFKRIEERMMRYYQKHLAKMLSLTYPIPDFDPEGYFPLNNDVIITVEKFTTNPLVWKL